MDIKNEISAFQFIASDVVEVSIKNNLLLCNSPKNELKRTFDIDYDIDYISNENGNWSGILSMSFSLSIDDDNTRVFDFHISMKGIFVAPYSMEQKIFENMLEINGLTALYGVARGTIASISSDVTNSERILLPMLNIKKIVEKKHSKIKTNEQ